MRRESWAEVGFSLNNPLIEEGTNRIAYMESEGGKKGLISGGKKKWD